MIKGGTVYSCFDYAIKDRNQRSPGHQLRRPAHGNGRETSLTKKGEISGAFERAIEGLALAANGMYVAYADTVANFNVAAILNGQAALTDASVQNAYIGKAAWTADQAARHRPAAREPLHSRGHGDQAGARALPDRNGVR